MLDRLPHDLIVDITDLAVPRPTISNLEERQETCRHLSLIHRTWTATAQKKLFEYLPITIPIDLDKLKDRLVAATADGRQLKGVEMRGPYKPDVRSKNVGAVLEHCGDIRRLVLKGFSELPLSWQSTPGLFDLSIRSRFEWLERGETWTARGSFGSGLAHSPSTLTRLFLSDIILGAPPPPLPHCHTLLMKRVSLFLGAGTGTFATSFPALRILGDWECAGGLNDFYSKLTHTVEHIMLSFWHVSYLEAIVEKRSLRSLTAPNTADLAPYAFDAYSLFREKAIPRGVELNFLPADTDDVDMEEWEEWALSLE